MIKFEHTEVVGWEAAIRGMRNPKNSWDKSDSVHEYHPNEELRVRDHFVVGENDHKLAMMLRNAGTDHRKFMRMITVYVDITAPLYWWKEFDTYKVGTVADSCSTMHKIADKEFELADFSFDKLLNTGCDLFTEEWEHGEFSRVVQPTDFLADFIIPTLNVCRKKYLESKNKDYWWQMIQLLPSSYNQKRTVMMNYEVIANAVKPGSRLHHKLDEWNVDKEGSFCQWALTLPYPELIFGQESIDSLNKEDN